MNVPSAVRRVLVPRAEGAGGALATLLADAGLAPEPVALLTIGPPTDEAGFDAAVLALAAGEYDWVGFASAHGAAAVARRMAELAVAVPADTRVAAVGAATAAALRSAGIPVDLRPAHGGTAAVLVDLWPHATGNRRVLLPSSEIGLTVLSDGLTAKGYRVDRVAAYAPRPLPASAAVTTDLRDGAYDAVLLTSPSLARAVAELRPADRIRMVAIGATTAAGAVAVGLRVDAVADDPTPTGLLTALRRALAVDPAPP
ncbi:uroporphyrinogen-III synthase [Nakamurella deserti]|uniref:uroporphyrinogen-III synthase n=1 Tax=Nakamurella deserti TaxID=2164074 RepID=UPI000DBE12E9|nr:uroporphyrinogen-III synthase [Nakamurella deserti]